MGRRTSNLPLEHIRILSSMSDSDLDSTHFYNE